MPSTARIFVVPKRMKLTAIAKTVPAMTVSIVSWNGSTQPRPFLCTKGMIASYTKDSRTQISSLTRSKASMASGLYSWPSTPSKPSAAPLPKPYSPSLAGQTGLKVSGVKSAFRPDPSAAWAAPASKLKPPASAPTAGRTSIGPGKRIAFGAPGAGRKHRDVTAEANKRPAAVTATARSTLRLLHRPLGERPCPAMVRGGWAARRG
mmetsp:Transcript_15495/g.27498  ORF Transcript_15495/g.27498 Transcript_15495/m.27498 type:complete len:206 (-) Transcript_15495:2-619(-)